MCFGVVKPPLDNSFLKALSTPTFVEISRLRGLTVRSHAGRWCLGEAESNLPQPPLHTKMQDSRHLEAAATELLSRACRFPGSSTGSQRTVGAAVRRNPPSLPETAETAETLRHQPVACEEAVDDSGDVVWLQNAHTPTPAAAVRTDPLSIPEKRDTAETLRPQPVVCEAVDDSGDEITWLQNANTTTPFGALRGSLSSVAATLSFTQERTTAAGVATHAHSEGARAGAAETRPADAELPGGSPSRQASAALVTHGAWCAAPGPLPP